MADQGRSLMAIARTHIVNLEPEQTDQKIPQSRGHRFGSCDLTK